MEVVLLGTGSADGWPNPFCTCASCEVARARGEVRGQTAVIVDDVLLLDAGPEVPRAAERLGRPLAAVRHLLLTHAHPDHTGPALLMWRGWTGASAPLDVVGPAAAVEECRPWAAGDQALRWHEVRAGDRLQVGGYDVRVLAAAHGDDRVGPAVLYDVTGPDGARFLHASDTRELPEATLAATGGAAYDLVLMEETNGERTDLGTDHLDLVSFPAQLAELRRRGAVVDGTRVVAVHLSHHNPPTPELARRLAAWGAEVLPDGAVLAVGAADRPARRPPRRVLVLGGARSGKSAEAERRLAAEPEVTYVATSWRRDGDGEWAERVARHRGRRPTGWRTVETLEVADVLRDAADPVLLDCVTLWLAGVMDEPGLADRLDAFVAAWRDASTDVVAVSNEVGAGVVPEHPSGRRFRDLLGELNARLAAAADEVWLMTAGLPQRLK